MVRCGSDWCRRAALNVPRERPAVEALARSSSAANGASLARRKAAPGTRSKAAIGQRRSRRAGSRSLKQEIGNRRSDLHERHLVEDVVQIHTGDSGVAAASVSRPRDRSRRAAATRRVGLHQRGIDIRDSVGKRRRGPRAAVVQFVGVEHVHSPGRHMRRRPEPERLHAFERWPIAYESCLWGEKGLADEAPLNAFETVCAASEAHVLPGAHQQRRAGTPSED